MQLTVNDFFCGAGGVGIGFEKAGYDIIWACDFDKYCVETYRKNVGDHVLQADIKKLIYTDIPKADVWAFGFPCQDLSVAGKQKGFRFVCKDCGKEWGYDEEMQQEGIKCPNCGGANYQAASRSGMFFEMMRLLDETAQKSPENIPLALFIENVKGLKPYIPVLEQELTKRGYAVHIQLYNSKYWNVPQNRERYFIVGTLKNVQGFEFPEEQHRYVPKLSSVLEKNVDEKYYISDEKAQKIIQQALEKLESLGTVHPTLTPAREKRRQNGPRAKGDEEDMFTLTAQDIHGVIVCEEKIQDPLIIQTPRGKNTGNIHEIVPTLTSNAYQENNFVFENTADAEKVICGETGLLDPNGCGKTLRVGGGGSLSKKHNYQHVLVKNEIGGNVMSELRLAGVLENSGTTQEHNNRVYDVDGISPTLTAVSGGTHHIKIFDPSRYRVRKLTPTEYGRLQAFPMEDWEQVVSDSQAYKQFGNAVTVTVVTAIADNLRTVLIKAKEQNRAKERTENPLSAFSATELLQELMRRQAI